MTRKRTVGVMGAGDNTTEIDTELGFELGKLIAAEGWVLISGGRNAGVMDSVNHGAKAGGGLTVGIIPRQTDAVSEAVDIVIITDMGSARNNVNVLSSDVVISCGHGGAGTASEIALALKANKHVILLNEIPEGQAFFKTIGKDLMHTASTPAQAVALAKKLLG
jgi:uncharacterized protein (TIGR00725 family)